jgi:hypothetical protein
MSSSRLNSYAVGGVVGGTIVFVLSLVVGSFAMGAGFAVDKKQTKKTQNQHQQNDSKGGVSLEPTSSKSDSNLELASYSGSEGRKLADLNSEANFQNLPVSDVEVSQAEKSEGRVILIPQTHRSPGKSKNSEANDRPLKAQKEIFQILEEIDNKSNLETVMVEGKIEGKIPKEQIKSVTKLNRLRNSLATNKTKLKREMKESDISQPALVNKMNSTIKSMDRELYLVGAPYVLSAESESVTPVGIEDKKVKQKSAKIVKNYLYQKKRMQQLKLSGGNQGGVLAKLLARRSQNGSSQDLLERMKNMFIVADQSNGGVSNPKNRSSSLLIKNLKQKASNANNIELTQVISDIEQTYREIDRFKQERELVSKEESSSGLGYRNKYQNENSLSQLKREHQRTKQKIQSVVVEERNKVVAENVADRIKKKDSRAGVLVFGVGHKQGLVNQLNKQNLDVVTVMVDSVEQEEKRL